MPRLPSSASDGSKNPLGLGFGSAEDVKVWEDTSCPICMEIPHNAVLLRCSSFDNGCRPFMCNTSRRHSNCFDQFCKTSASAATLREIPLDSTCRSWGCQSPSPMLLCPLCRGQIYGWSLVKQARQFMNNKARSCSSETCGFKGTYSELRKHARSDHPNVRPTEVDSNRQRDWLRFELLRNYEGSDSGEESPFDYSDSDTERSDSNTEDSFRPRPRPRPRSFRYESDSNIDNVLRPNSRLVRFRYINVSNIEDMFRLRSRRVYISDSSTEDSDSNMENMFRPRLRQRGFRYDNDSYIEDTRPRSRSRSRHRRFRYDNDPNVEHVRSRPRHRRFRYDHDSNTEDVRSRHRRFRYDPEVESGRRGHCNFNWESWSPQQSFGVDRFRARRRNS